MDRPFLSHNSTPLLGQGRSLPLSTWTTSRASLYSPPLTLHSPGGIQANFIILGLGAVGSRVRPHQPTPAGFPPANKQYPNLPGSTGSSNSLDRGPGGVEWPGQGPPPVCVGKPGPTSMQTNDLPQLLLGRSGGKKSCATRKPWHRLSRDGSPREPPLPRE